MRDRHVPRLCPSCEAPMVRQDELCWQCGADWPPEDLPPRTPAQVSGADEHVTAARLDLERWSDEGGSVSDGSASSWPPRGTSDSKPRDDGRRRMLTVVAPGRRPSPSFAGHVP